MNTSIIQWLLKHAQESMRLYPLVLGFYSAVSEQDYAKSWLILKQIGDIVVPMLVDFPASGLAYASEDEDALADDFAAELAARKIDWAKLAKVAKFLAEFIIPLLLQAKPA